MQGGSEFDRGGKKTRPNPPAPSGAREGGARQDSAAQAPLSVAGRGWGRGLFRDCFLKQEHAYFWAGASVRGLMSDSLRLMTGLVQYEGSSRSSSIE